MGAERCTARFCERRSVQMNTIFCLVGLLLFASAAMFYRDNLSLIANLSTRSMAKVKLVAGILGVAGALAMFLLLKLATYEFGYSVNDVRLDLFNARVSRGVVLLFLLVMLVGNVVRVLGAIGSLRQR